MKEHTRTIRTDDFDGTTLRHSGTAVVDFWAPWCGPCLTMGPVIETLAKEFEGTALVGKLNVDDESEIAARFGVQSIPTIVFFEGGVEVDRVVGVTTIDTLRQKVAAVVAA